MNRSLADGVGSRFMSYVALSSLILAIVLPVLIAALGGEEYAPIVGIAMISVALVLGIASRETLLERIAVGGSMVLILLIVAMGVLWAIQSR